MTNALMATRKRKRSGKPGELDKCRFREQSRQTIVRVVHIQERELGVKAPIEKDKNNRHWRAHVAVGMREVADGLNNDERKLMINALARAKEN
jgi:hypothetical protein